ncbi:hypothetical protein [uncultured Virgibacillus sp.]|uniref:hypothetical protein n=1 Tax=uncultured Virgibacillus sp. TaxID=417355 RepID=UPI00047D9159|nr:hypothetical protein [uncultured Virgibacillus sp.]QRZ17145.1 hypothetical protein JUJ52_15345 [Virgibacillus sp. AGTR]
MIEERTFVLVLYKQASYILDEVNGKGEKLRNQCSKENRLFKSIDVKITRFYHLVIGIKLKLFLYQPVLLMNTLILGDLQTP